MVLIAVGMVTIPAASAFAGEGDIYEGDDNNNTGEFVLTINMGQESVDIQTGDSTTVSCIIDPHIGILHTKLNGDIYYNTSTIVSSTDPSVARASYDLESGAISIDAYAAGTVTVTIGATLVYADPVSATLTVNVTDPPETPDEPPVTPPVPTENTTTPTDSGGGVDGGTGTADTNVIDGTGTADDVYLGTDVSPDEAVPLTEAPAAAKPSSGSVVTLVEMDTVDEVDKDTQETSTIPQSTSWLVLGVALACVLGGGTEMSISFKRRMA